MLEKIKQIIAEQEGAPVAVKALNFREGLLRLLDVLRKVRARKGKEGAVTDIRRGG